MKINCNLKEFPYAGRLLISNIIFTKFVRGYIMFPLPPPPFLYLCHSGKILGHLFSMLLYGTYIWFLNSNYSKSVVTQFWRHNNFLLRSVVLIYLGMIDPSQISTEFSFMWESVNQSKNVRKKFNLIIFHFCDFTDLTFKQK